MNRPPQSMASLTFSPLLPGLLTKLKRSLQLHPPTLRNQGICQGQTNQTAASNEEPEAATVMQPIISFKEHTDMKGDGGGQLYLARAPAVFVRLFWLLFLWRVAAETQPSFLMSSSEQGAARRPTGAGETNNRLYLLGRSQNNNTGTVKGF